MSRACWCVLAVVAAQVLGARTAEAQLTLTGNPQPLTISSAVAGSQPGPALDSSTRYTVSTVSLGGIVGSVDSPLPAGVRLWVRLQAPPGAVSMGWVELGTTPKDLVTGISIGTHSNLTVEYRLTTTVSAGVVPLGSRQITLRVRNL